LAPSCGVRYAKIEADTAGIVIRTKAFRRSAGSVPGGRVYKTSANGWACGQMMGAQLLIILFAAAQPCLLLALQFAAS
jgi:hypothetical protein